MLVARLFGPLELQVDGRHLGPRDLGGVKPRQLLEILLLDRGHIVPKERLAELLWGDAPPVNVSAAIDTYASTLRRRLEPDRGRRPSRYLLGGGGGLLAPAESTELDLATFDELLGQAADAGRSGALSAARSALDAALALVRGRPLEDEPYATWALRVRDTYAQRAAAARLTAGEHALAAGDLAAARPHAQAVLLEDPTSEAACRIVMRVAFLEGRQDEALRAYERCRRALAEELGVDPLPETLALHEAILRRDHTALAAGRERATPPAAARPAPAHPELPFLGRAAELTRLESTAHAALAGRGQLVLVEGEAGIGKTRLVTEALARLQPLRVGVGKCAEADRDLPYVPLAAALRDLGAPELPAARRLEALGEILPELPATALPPETARLRAFEAVADLLRALAPVALFVDDLQWSDPSTSAALAYLQRRCADDPVLLLGALRPEEVDAAAAVAALTPTLRLVLGPLGAGDVAPLGLGASELLARSGGHPLWLAELVQAGDDGTGPAPPRLAELIVARCRRAGPVAHRLLAAVSALGRPFSPELAAALTGDDAVVAAEHLEDLTARGLLRPVAADFDFRHDVIAETLAAGVSPARRRLLHERAYRALEAAGATPGELAGHALAAELAEPALRWSLKAAAAARRGYANVEAAEHYERARELAEAHPGLLDGPARETLLVELGRTLVTLGRVEAAEAALDEGRTSAADRGDGRAEFAALEGLAVARQRGASDPAGALALGRQALTVAQELGDDGLLARAHTLVGSPSGSLGLLADEIAHCSRAVALAEAAGAPPPAYAMGRVALGLHHEGREHAALHWSGRAENAALHQDDEEALLLARWVRALACVALGQGRAAFDALAACEAVGRGEEVFWHARIPNTYGSVLADICQHAAALDRDLESLAAVSPSSSGALREAELQARLNLAADHLGLGDLDAAEAQLADVRAAVDQVVYARFRWLPRLLFLETELAVAGGVVDDAMAAAEACLALASDPPQAKCAVRGRLALARAHLAAGEREPARRQARAAAADAEQHGFDALAWRCWSVACDAGAGAAARRGAQAHVLRVAGNLDEPWRSRFLAAVPADA